MFNLDSLIKIITNGNKTMNDCGVTREQGCIIIGMIIIVALIFDICIINRLKGLL